MIKDLTKQTKERERRDNIIKISIGTLEDMFQYLQSDNTPLANKILKNVKDELKEDIKKLKTL